MDNILQIREIRKYRVYLSTLIKSNIDEEIAARIWIRKYGKIWRLKHPVITNNPIKVSYDFILE